MIDIPVVAAYQQVMNKLCLVLLCLLAAVPALPRAGAAQEPNALRPWREYRTIMWVGDTVYKQPDKIPLFYQRLREMGINTSMVPGDSDPKQALANGFPYYVENIVNRGLCLKWSSKVADWDKFVTDWAKGGRPESALVRDYCLDDPQWREWARKQMQSAARVHRQHQPWAYDIRDELSTTISANPFDYDFNPICLGKFRKWLKSEYASLDALNTEWETTFASWDEVKPFTTDRIKNRMASGEPEPRGNPDWQAVQALKIPRNFEGQSPTRWNFSPWADFRTYMDISLASALEDCRQAAHEIDPATPVGIEGTQMPHAFGGYDLWQLSQALDWVEAYDIGNAREIFGSFMPGKPLMTTVFETDTDHARRRLWHLLLEGDRGCIIWWSEDCIDWKSPDYALTPKARALARVLKELTSPLGQQFLRAERERDPVYIHYSQACIQADWLLESTIDGSTWLRRFSSFEADHNRMAKVRNSWLKAFQDLGYSPRFISSQEIEAGGLPKSGNAILVLPNSLAMSEKELAEVRGFLSRADRGTKRKLFWDALPGVFDQHGKLRGKSPLEDLYSTADEEAAQCVALGGGQASSKRGEIRDYAVGRMQGQAGRGWTEWIGEQVKTMPAEVQLPSSACVRVHRFRAGDAQLLGFERNINYQMSEELKQAGGNEPLEKPAEIEAHLREPLHVYDLWNEKYLGLTDTVRFKLDPWRPSLFAISKRKLNEAAVVEQLNH